MTVRRRVRRAPPGVLLIALLVTVLVAGCRAAPAPRSPPCANDHRPLPQPPNILVFLVDDLGWQDISLPLHTVTTPFNERYRTPNVERLAARGMTFTQAYASAPVCSPTRTSLMTGASPARNHITYWILREGQDTSAPWEGLLPPDWNVDGLQPGDVTLPGLLRESGYRTIHVGKAHLGAVGTPGENPLALGFDVNIAGHGAGAPASYLGTESFRRGGVWDVPGLEAWHDRDIFLTEALAEEASAAVRQSVGDGVPFFLHMAPYAVHTPITANERYMDHYSALPSREAAYASMIETVDAALGTLLDLLDELGVSDDTLVVFTSDNGGLSAHGRDGEPHTHNAPLRSGKGSAYEGGVRVPAVIAWPGHIVPGSRSDVPIITHDLFPTLLTAASIPIPVTHRPRVDGHDLTALLMGEEQAEGALEPRDLLWHQPHYWGVPGPGIEPYSALRSGDWKLIHRHADGGLELYDLAHDPGETKDLAADQPERVATLARRLGDALRAADAQRSRDAATGAPIDWPDADS
jgi:arylsulfatase A-like enzyme